MEDNKDYIEKVRLTLTDVVDGFDKDEATFRKALSDPKYAENVRLTLIDAVDGFDKDSATFSNLIGLKKKDLSQSGSAVGSKPSQDTNIGVPFAKTDNASPFDYTNPDYNSQVQKKAIEDKAIFEKGKQVVAPYKQKNDQFNAITPSAVHTKRYRAADGDIAEIEDPQSYLSNAYTSAAWNQIPSTVTSLFDKNPTQKLALVKEISENPELRQKLTKFGSAMSQAEYRSTIDNVLAKAANKRNEEFKALEASGMQEKLNKASATTQILKVKLDELKALDTNLNFIKNTTANSAGYKAITDGIKTKKKEIDLYSPEVLVINKLGENIKSQESGFETKYGQYKDPSTGRFLIKDQATADAFNSDVAKLQESYNIYNQKIKSPEYEKYTEDVSVYNDLIAKQEKANEPILKANQQFNATLKKREKLVGEISGLSNELKQYDALNKDLDKYKQLANENKEYSFLVGDKVLSGALLQRLPQEYSRELSKLSKEIDNINSGAFIMPTTEFTGRLLSSTVDMFYKMGGNALGIIGDINQEYQDLIGAGNKKDYTWFDWEQDKSLDFMQTNGPQFIDRPAIDPKTGDIVWSNIPYVAASSSGSMLGNILIGAVTGGSSMALVATTYLSTIGDRYKEADQMGLTGEQSFVYANSLAMLEGLSELIMPDYDLFKGLQKAGLAEFIKSGKGLTVKAAIDYSFKHGLKDIPKEIVEEYIVNAGEILNKSAILLADGKFNKDTFVNTLGNPKDYAVTALTTALIPAGMKALTVTGQGRTMYNNIMYDASRNLSASQQAISNLVDAKQLTEAQADQINKDLVRYSAVNSILPQDIIAEKAVVVTPLLEEVQRLKAKHAESAVDVVKSTYEAQIRELNNKIQEVLLKPNSEFMTPSQVEEVKNELSIEDTDALNAKKEELKLKLTQPLTVSPLEGIAPTDIVTPIEDGFSKTDLTEEQRVVASQYKERLSKLKQEDPEQYWSVDLPDDDVIADAIKNDRLVDIGGGMGIVTEDGNMIGMFKYDQSAKGTASAVQGERIKKGGIKLDNFDGYLTRTYQKNGFRVVARVPFNEEFAPEGWNKEKHGTPDVVMMVYDPDNKLDIEEKTFTDPNTGYDDAQAYRDSYVENAKKNQQSPVVENTAEQPVKKEPAKVGIGEYYPSDEIKEKDAEVLSNVLSSKNIQTMAEPRDIVDFGDTVVFEFYDGTEDNSHTRITFKRKKNGELTAQGVKIQEGVGNIRGSKTFENFVASQEKKLKENKEEEHPLVSGLKKVNQLLKGMQDEKKSESSKVTIVEQPKQSKNPKVSKAEKELARINEDIALAESTIEQNIIDIENKSEELEDEKGHRDYDVKELQQKIAEVRKKKMPKDEKEDEIESIRYDIEDRKDDYDVMYEEEMANIKEMKAENKKLEKKLITLKLKRDSYVDGSVQEIAAEEESVKKPVVKKDKKSTDINAKFAEVSELYEKVRAAKSQSETTASNRKLSAFLNLNPTVKYIFENMNELQKQLGERLKKNAFCP